MYLEADIRVSGCPNRELSVVDMVSILNFTSLFKLSLDHVTEPCHPNRVQRSVFFRVASLLTLFNSKFKG
jgi:hypothetical protein